MKTIFAATLFAGLAFAGFNAAQAMPIGADANADTLMTHVAMGCGPGMARGPYGRCRPMMARPMVRRACPPRFHLTPRGVCRPNF